LRLDAVPYLFERESTNCENLPETHAFLRELRAHVDRGFKNRMLLAEANQWPEDSAAYFGRGDECHMAFHFPIMPRLYMSMHMEDRFPIIEILEDTPPIPDSCQWALFLRNHDELTLEMVTDEERDYMRRMYAPDPRARINLGIRRRLAPLVSNNRRRIELLNGLLYSLPGTPVLYYGDEIGMGDNFHLGDRNGVRTPMQWSSDRNAGFSAANPQQLFLPVVTDPEYHYEAVNVEIQQANPQSLLWWTKRLIALRKRHPAFGRGTIEFLHPDNPKVLAFVREHGGERILVVANLSRFTQHVALDLARYPGHVPVELFGQTEFPAVGEPPYVLTPAPHTFFWFLLRPPTAAAGARSAVAELPALEVAARWDAALTERNLPRLEPALDAYIRARRWYGGKGRTRTAMRVVEYLPIPDAEGGLLQVRAPFTEGPPDTYQVALAFCHGEQAEALRRSRPECLVAALRVTGPGRAYEGVLYDAMGDPAFCHALLDCFLKRRVLKGRAGTAVAEITHHLRPARTGTRRLSAHPVRGEQSNSSVIYGKRFILKLLRRVEEGIHPEVEISRHLTEREFAHTPPLAGALEFRNRRGQPKTLAILSGLVHNERDAWSHALDELERFFERALSQPEPAEAHYAGHLLDLAGRKPPPLAEEVIGPYLASVRLLGRRTAELHLALADDRGKPDFKPEPFSTLYQRSVYQSMRGLTAQTFRLLRSNLSRLPADVRAAAEQMLGRQPEVLNCIRGLARGKVLDATRQRYHGDYHLGQVLFTGKDFVIIDFEGEPARPLSERRIKRSVLRDVAGMVRSFDYAVVFAQRLAEAHAASARARRRIETWAVCWRQWVAAAFLGAYLEGTAAGNCLPKDGGQLRILLDAFILEKAIYELGYELNNRPDWLAIPLVGMARILDALKGQTPAPPARPRGK
jgi:maltose alpha-D-glucosyltransferase/alpha-amylase